MAQILRSQEKTETLAMMILIKKKKKKRNIAFRENEAMPSNKA